jgi:hypothetical protein
VPRVVNLALAAFLLLFVAPVVTNFAGLPGYAQVTLGLLVALVLLFVTMSLASALRPGSVGRFLRRLRRHRQR